MRILLTAIAILMMLSAARADLAPPPVQPAILPSAPAEIAAVKDERVSELRGRAESGRDDLNAMIASVQALKNADKGARTVTPYAELPTNPCKSGMTAAWRRCVQWLRTSTIYMEAAALDLMRVRLSESLADLRTVARRMADAIEEQKALARGLGPPARAIPKNPCQGWNVTFWQECVARVDAALAGNLPDDASAAEIIRARDRLSKALQVMIDEKATGARRITGARSMAESFADAVLRAMTRCAEAQRALARSVKPAR